MKILVFGDTFQELQNAPNDYYGPPLSQLGGAGNVALNLSAALPAAEIVLPVAYQFSYQPTKIKMPRLYGANSLIRTMPVRDRRNQNVRRVDPHQDWSKFKDQAPEEYKLLTRSLASHILDANLIMIEWHHEFKFSLGYVIADLLSKMEEMGLYIPSVYLDMRHPTVNVLAYFMPLYWKLNREEQKILGDSLEESPIVFLKTFAENGAALCDEKITTVTSSHHKRVDETGCGDTFSAYFIAGIMNGLTRLEAMKTAIIAAGVACSCPGVVTVRPQDILIDYYLFERKCQL